jgi:hypothetical protein
MICFLKMWVALTGRAFTLVKPIAAEQQKSNQSQAIPVNNKPGCSGAVPKQRPSHCKGLRQKCNM